MPGIAKGASIRSFTFQTNPLTHWSSPGGKGSHLLQLCQFLAFYALRLCWLGGLTFWLPFVERQCGCSQSSVETSQFRTHHQRDLLVKLGTKLAYGFLEWAKKCPAQCHQRAGENNLLRIEHHVY